MHEHALATSFTSTDCMASLLKQNMVPFILKFRFRLLTDEKLSQNSVMRSLNKRSHKVYSQRSINGRGLQMWEVLH